ncbi:Heavy metal-associated domain, HMA [Sesbania bispinosa]|nr:Heavy metal-associated domain, HMA [Sesbania bispinosa]
MLISWEYAANCTKATAEKNAYAYEYPKKHGKGSGLKANCCEGCKRKVKRALRSIEGVLKTDIDPLHPKITVLGNVNPHILIKRLSKVGKHAELCSYVEVQDEKIALSREKEKQDSGCEHEKKHCDIKIEKSTTKDVTQGGEGIKNKGSKQDNNKDTNMIIANASDPQEIMKRGDAFLPHSEVNFMVQPSMQPYSNIITHPQYCYIAQPCAFAAPYYAMPSSYPACFEEYYHFDKPRFQPPFLRPTVQVGDYFSDENTMGCHVM